MSMFPFIKKGKDLGMYPAFRPDKSYSIENPTVYNAYLSTLGETVGFSINSYEKLLEAMSKRIDYFHERGCRLSDHGLEQLYFSKKMPSQLIQFLRK